MTDIKVDEARATPLHKQDIEHMTDALQTIKDIEERAIARATVWVHMTKHSLRHSFMNDKGYSVRLANHTLGKDEVSFYFRDEQGRGSSVEIKVPAKFIFEETDESKEFAEFVRLSGKFGKLS